MSQFCSTVRIKTEPSEGNPSGIVVINESDFDAETMTKHEETEEAPKAPVAPAPLAPEAPKAKGAKAVAPWAA